MSKAAPALLWFRRDLRLADNAALMATFRQDKAIIPIFILDEVSAGQRPLGGAARWWLGRSLDALRQSLEKRGSRLILHRGATLSLLRHIIGETGARTIHFNRRFDPPGVALDQQVSEALRADGIEVEDHDANYLHEPWQLRTKQGEPFKVFTPFWRRLSDQYSPPALGGAPRRWPSPTPPAKSEPIEKFSSEHHWTKGFDEAWQPGEAGASKQLKEFLDDAVDAYGSHRDRPDLPGTSRLSPHLAWGEISVHRAWRQTNAVHSTGAAAFRRELAWRDFNMHIYAHFPDLPTIPWQTSFRDFPFKKDSAGLRAWQQGQTGYPLVDAGMRELWRTGWMHNRVRMVVASFLIKHQLIDWRCGEDWFWDTLVDADPAQNAGNWQWVAGCGFDAAPFFRIFNPTLQGKKFDPKGNYTRHWVPELASCETKKLQQPWKLSAASLREAGITLGKDYPKPIVDHDGARIRALSAYRAIKGKTAKTDSAPSVQSKTKGGPKAARGRGKREI
jgi:deoxyribodipyrimidine photo-lyase